MANFSRGQRNGLIVLSIIIVISLFIPEFYNTLYTKNYSSSFAQFEKEIESAKKERPQKKAYQEESVLFSFNPNTASEHDFRRLGLSNKQIKQILNYRNKKGWFYSKADFSKIYAIDDDTYHRLEAYILIPRKQKAKTKKQFSKPKSKKKNYKKIIVEINSASSTELEKVYGLGASLSLRIVNYRDALGGFIDKKQIKEVYGIDDEKYTQIEKYISVNNLKVKQINVNFSTAKVLSKHPYIGAKRAKNIAKNKTFNGKYKSLKDLSNRMNWEDSYIQKLEPYLKF